MTEKLVSPYVPFPNIWWWWQAQLARTVVLDASEHFVKMGYRNRYYITGGNGSIMLTVPLLGGRDQRSRMSDVLIDNNERWQVLQWRTIASVYGRAPYFEHYAVSLQPLFNQVFEKLVDFNHASMQWLKKETGINFEEVIATDYKKYKEENITDLRSSFKPGVEKTPLKTEQALYYQLFAERNGFYPNLSMLDMLFCKGPAVKNILKQQSDVIGLWQDSI